MKKGLDVTDWLLGNDRESEDSAVEQKVGRKWLRGLLGHGKTNILSLPGR